MQGFMKTWKKERFYPLPLEGATPGGGDYFYRYLNMLPPSPNPLPSQGGGAFRAKIY